MLSTDPNCSGSGGGGDLSFKNPRPLPPPADTVTGYWCLEMQPTHSTQPAQHPFFLRPSHLLLTQVVLDFGLTADDRPPL